MTLDHLGVSLFDCRYRVTVPSGAVVGFVDHHTFSGYVRVWRDQGYLLDFPTPFECSISKGLRSNKPTKTPTEVLRCFQ